MKAKNIFTKGFLLASVFALSGCSSFLDEKNWSSQSAEEYYATAEGYESLINGAYSTLKRASYYFIPLKFSDIETVLFLYNFYSCSQSIAYFSKYVYPHGKFTVFHI